MRYMSLLAVIILMPAIILLPEPVFGQGIPGVTGAGSGTFPAGTKFNGVTLNSLQFGMGNFITDDSLTSGEIQATLVGTSLLGRPQTIELDGQTTSGTANLDGSRTFSGTATIDLGDGGLA